MKFSILKFSRRFPEVECAILHYYQPLPQTPKGVTVPPMFRSTVAAFLLPNGRYWLGISTCSPGDEFVRVTGHAKAQGRAIQDYVHIVPNGTLDLSSQTCFKELHEEMKKAIEGHQKEIIVRKVKEALAV